MDPGPRMNPIAHLRRLWGPWWPLVALPLLLIVFWAAIDDLRIEHVVSIAAIMALAVFNAASRDLLVAVLPGIAIALGYDLIRHPRPLFVTPERVIGCEIQSLEQALFGFGTGRAPADWFVDFNAPWADLFFAIPYTLFWPVVVLYALVLFFRDRALLARFLWVLALVHFAAFVIWLVWPVAPPWYLREHGCTIDPGAAPSAAALLRIDAMLGIGYFHEFYSRAPTVFGAMPSLHVSFPAVAAITAWGIAGRGWRIVLAGLTVWMVAASVYLDHHWLLDGLVTLLITGCVHLLCLRFWPSYARGWSGRWGFGGAGR